MIFKVMVLALITASCATPEHWSAENHKEMLLQCRVACLGSGVASYESFLGQCKCHKLPLNSDE